MKNNSNAWDVILMEKRKFDKMFVVWGITFIALVISVFYNFYLLNDIGTIETTEEVSQENTDGNNNFIGNDGDIINGNSKN